jgi:hypothetical protein
MFLPSREFTSCFRKYRYSKIQDRRLTAGDDLRLTGLRPAPSERRTQPMDGQTGACPIEPTPLDRMLTRAFHAYFSAIIRGFARQFAFASSAAMPSTADNHIGLSGFRQGRFPPLKTERKSNPSPAISTKPDAECPPELTCRAATEAFLAESRTAHISESNTGPAGPRSAAQPSGCRTVRKPA